MNEKEMPKTAISSGGIKIRGEAREELIKRLIREFEKIDKESQKEYEDYLEKRSVITHYDYTEGYIKIDRDKKEIEIYDNNATGFARQPIREISGYLKIDSWKITFYVEEASGLVSRNIWKRAREVIKSLPVEIISEFSFEEKIGDDIVATGNTIEDLKYL